MVIAENIYKQDNNKLRRMDNEGRYVCTRCGKSFLSNTALKLHMQLHTGHYDFYSDTCKKGFLIKRDYNEHMRAHQGLKYHCDYCSKPLLSQKNLRYHLSGHTGQYRFTCNVCGKGYNPKIEYEKHVRSHT